jgi:hypothetical protein
MGLSISVGLLAAAVAAGDEEEVAFLRPTYDNLNAVLRGAGLAPHDEPLAIAESQYFEAEMGGYSALHAVRRLAAHLALRGQLPPPVATEDAPDDPVLAELYDAHDRYLRGPPLGRLGKLFGWQPAKPRFQHLLCHSDCEGFYLSRDFNEIIFDDAEPQLEGIGGMIGSSVRLLAECRELAEAIALPAGIDPEDEELWELWESPAAEGPAWRRYGTEAHGLAALIRGCERSVETGAALVFA